MPASPRRGFPGTGPSTGTGRATLRATTVTCGEEQPALDAEIGPEETWASVTFEAPGGAQAHTPEPTSLASTATTCDGRGTGATVAAMDRIHGFASLSGRGATAASTTAPSVASGLAHVPAATTTEGDDVTEGGAATVSARATVATDAT